MGQTGGKPGAGGFQISSFSHRKRLGGAERSVGSDPTSLQQDLDQPPDIQCVEREGSARCWGF